MRVVILFILLLFCSGYGNSQTLKIQNIMLRNIKKSVTHYGNKVAYTEASTTYDLMLANPMLVCDVPGYEVSHFTITLTVPPGLEFYGPFSTAGSALKEQVLTWIKAKKDKKEMISIVIEDIEVTNNGKKEPLKGTLVYHCK